jgi:hypothetical protein
MRAIAVLAMSCLTASSVWAAGFQDEFAERLAGPWGRVDVNWRPYAGVLAKNSCPEEGVRRSSTVGLFGDGGTMWIEAEPGGLLKWHDGSSLVRMLQFVRIEAGAEPAAVYREATGVQRRFALVAADRLKEERLPTTDGAPIVRYTRCKKRK